MNAKKQLITVAIVLIAICLLVAGFMAGLKLSQKDVYHQMEALYKVHSQAMTNEARTVIRNELKAFYPHVDSLATASGIKIKQIERTTFIDHKIVLDTIPVNLTPDTANNKVVNMHADFACLEAKGIIDFTKTSITPTKDDINKMRVLLTDVTVNDRLTTIYYFEREKKRILFINMRIGRKHYFADTYSSCKAETKTETINIIKR